MNSTLNHESASELSNKSLDSTSITLESVPFKRKNPKFENMRSSLKNSLFNTERTHSYTVAPTINNHFHSDDDRVNPKSLNLENTHNSSPQNKSNMEKYRKLIKGTLFPQSQPKSICSLEKFSEHNESHDKACPSHSSFVFTPTNTGHDEHHDNSMFGSYIGKDGLHDTTHKHEEGHSLDQSLNSHHNRASVLSGPLIQSLDYLESPSRDSDYRSSVFLRDVESEIDEIKRDLEVEHDPNIHFIRGNFYAYHIEGEILGEGTTGTVKKCIRMSDNVAVAVKVVHYRDDLEVLTLIVKEFQNQRKLKHKNIIKVYDLYIDYFKKKIYTVMELAECREMFDVLKDLGHYSEAVASGIFKQILAGINYLHINGVCHRDLKPNNLLVSEDGKIVKITDFNVSKFIQNKKKKFSFLSAENYKMWTYTGTIAFTAPEVFNDSEYTEAIDMWSAGVVLYTMLCGYQPFQAEYVQDLIEKIKTGHYEFPSDPWDNISKQAKNLVRHCLSLNPRTRYCPSEALMHPWITNCGKNSSTSIPKTQAHLRRYIKRNTLKRNTHYHGGARTHKHALTTICHPYPAKTCDKCSTKQLGTIPQGDESSANIDDSGDTIKQTHISNLQPKRGKTGPEGAEVFRPNFLKLEKSFSFTALEDPHYEGEKYPEDDENFSDEDEKEDIPYYKLTNEIRKINVKPSSKDDEAIKSHKTEDWLADITNNKNNKLVKSKKKVEESHDTENKKTPAPAVSIQVKKDGKENTENSENNGERIWLDKNIYSEPLKTQE